MLGTIYQWHTWWQCTTALKTEDLMDLLIAQSYDLHTRLWKVLRSKGEENSKLLIIGVDVWRQSNVETAISATDVASYMCTCRGKTKERHFGGDIRWKTYRVPQRNLGSHRGWKHWIQQGSKPTAQDIRRVRVESVLKETALKENGMSEGMGDTTIVEKGSKPDGEQVTLTFLVHALLERSEIRNEGHQLKYTFAPKSLSGAHFNQILAKYASSLIPVAFQQSATCHFKGTILDVTFGLKSLVSVV